MSNNATGSTMTVRREGGRCPYTWEVISLYSLIQLILAVVQRGGSPSHVRSLKSRDYRALRG